MLARARKGEVSLASASLPYVELGWREAVDGQEAAVGQGAGAKIKTGMTHVTVSTCMLPFRVCGIPLDRFSGHKCIFKVYRPAVYHLTSLEG